MCPVTCPSHHSSDPSGHATNADKATAFGFEPEITSLLARADARIYEVPISYAGRTYAEGKKIGWKDGVAAFWHITRFNLFR